MKSDQLTQDVVMVKIRRHFKFLAGMLIETLSSNDKILVYRPEHPAVNLADVNKLGNAVENDGRCRILWLTTSPDEAAAGLVEWLIDGRVMLGTLPWFSETTFAAGAAFDAWLKIYNAALLLVSHAADQEPRDAGPTRVNAGQRHRGPQATGSNAS